MTCGFAPKRRLAAGGVVARKRGRSDGLNDVHQLDTQQIVNHFNRLSNDPLLLIFGKVYSSASVPSDCASLALTCKRFRAAAMDPQVLLHASEGALSVSAKRWCESSERFLHSCATAGNLEALYILGMIRFYCLGDSWLGAFMLARAALGGHATAAYALAIVHFNGSAGTREDRNVQGGVLLCGKAAGLGSLSAMRELGHCYQDGYGIIQNVQIGRRVLLQANARELLACLTTTTLKSTELRASLAEMCPSAIPPPSPSAVRASLMQRPEQESSKSYPQVTALEGSHGLSLANPSLPPVAKVSPSNSTPTVNASPSVTLSPASSTQEGSPLQASAIRSLKLTAATPATCEHGFAQKHDQCRGPVSQMCLVFGSGVSREPFHLPRMPVPAANSFLLEWFSLHPPKDGLQLCGNERCGRPETRLHEFRCCMICSKSKYCTRTCQVADWLVRHRHVCEGQGRDQGGD